MSAEVPTDILYIGRFKLPEGNAATARVLGVAKVLRMLGYSVSLVGLARSAGESGSMEVSGFPAYGIHEVGIFDRLKGATTSEWLRIGMSQFGKPSAAIFYNFPSPALAASAAVLRSRGVSALADCTEWYTRDHSNPAVGLARALDSRIRNAGIQPRLDGVIAISDWLARYYEGKANCIQIPPLVDVAESKWRLPPVSRNGGSLRLVYAGDPGTNKEALGEVIDTCRRLRDELPTELQIYGLTVEGYLALRPEERSIVEGASDVTFEGHVSHGEVLRAVHGADYAIFPRKVSRASKAGFSTKMVEAVTLGTGVITTPVGDAERVLGDVPGVIFAEDTTSQSLEGALRRAWDGRSSVTHELSDRYDFHNWASEVGRFLASAGLPSKR